MNKRIVYKRAADLIAERRSSLGCCAIAFVCSTMDGLDGFSPAAQQIAAEWVGLVMEPIRAEFDPAGQLADYVYPFDRYPGDAHRHRGARVKAMRALAAGRKDRARAILAAYWEGRHGQA